MNAYNANDKQERQGAMFPIVSLLMHETNTHQQNCTGRRYEPIQDKCAHTDTNTGCVDLHSPSEVFLSLQQTRLQMGAADPKVTRLDNTLGGEKPLDGNKGQHTEERYTNKKKRSHFFSHFVLQL